MKSVNDSYEYCTNFEGAYIRFPNNKKCVDNLKKATKEMNRLLDYCDTLEKVLLECGDSGYLKNEHSHLFQEIHKKHYPQNY